APRQSPSSLIFASISFEGAAPAFAFFAPTLFVFFIIAFFTVIARPKRKYRYFFLRRHSRTDALPVRSLLSAEQIGPRRTHLEGVQHGKQDAVIAQVAVVELVVDRNGDSDAGLQLLVDEEAGTGADRRERGVVAAVRAPHLAPVGEAVELVALEQRPVGVLIPTQLKRAADAVVVGVVARPERRGAEEVLLRQQHRPGRDLRGAGKLQRPGVGELLDAHIGTIERGEIAGRAVDRGHDVVAACAAEAVTHDQGEIVPAVEIVLHAQVGG